MQAGRAESARLPELPAVCTEAEAVALCDALVDHVCGALGLQVRPALLSNTRQAPFYVPFGFRGCLARATPLKLRSARRVGTWKL